MQFCVKFRSEKHQNTKLTDSTTKVFDIFTREAYFFQRKTRFKIIKREKTEISSVNIWRRIRRRKITFETGIYSPCNSYHFLLLMFLWKIYGFRCRVEWNHCKIFPGSYCHRELLTVKYQLFIINPWGLSKGVNKNMKNLNQLLRKNEKFYIKIT